MRTESIDSIRGLYLIEQENLGIVNLNALIRSGWDTQYIEYKFRHKLDNISKINLCNLSSLCYRLRINYTSNEVSEIIKTVVAAIKNIKSDIIFTQNSVVNYMEEDIKPYDKLIDISDASIKIIRPVRDIFQMLGYTNQQISQIILNYGIKVINRLPQDAFRYIARPNNETNSFYIKLKELMC